MSADRSGKTWFIIRRQPSRRPPVVPLAPHRAGVGLGVSALVAVIVVLSLISLMLYLQWKERAAQRPDVSTLDRPGWDLALKPPSDNALANSQQMLAAFLKRAYDLVLWDEMGSSFMFKVKMPIVRKPKKKKVRTTPIKVNPIPAEQLLVGVIGGGGARLHTRPAAVKPAKQRRVVAAPVHKRKVYRATERAGGAIHLGR